MCNKFSGLSALRQHLSSKGESADPSVSLANYCMQLASVTFGEEEGGPACLSHEHKQANSCKNVSISICVHRGEHSCFFSVLH